MLRLPIVLILAFLMTPVAGWSSPDQDPLAYPRVTETAGLRLTVHHPVIDTWTNYQIASGWVPIEVDEESRTWVGAVRVQARTDVDLERRTVALSDSEVIRVQFSDPDAPEAVTTAAAGIIQNRRQTVLLDDILHMLAEDFTPPPQSSVLPIFSQRPPRIVFSETPMQLLLIDQQPVMAPLSGTRLEAIVNTDWTVLFDTGTSDYYVINQGVWQRNSLLASGGWTTIDELPGDIERLALGEDWPAVREALPARLPESEPEPFLVSLEATELVVIKGEPLLRSIPATQIEGQAAVEEVINTASDLFKSGRHWYLLAAGRWFTTTDPAIRWQAVENLPAGFSRIPVDHPRANVLASVPGTPEARAAVIEASIPRTNILSSDSQPGDPIMYDGEPRFEPIANTTVARAVNTPFAVIKHNNFYYWCYEAAWYFSSSPEGPWSVALTVPDAIWEIPASSPVHYVTYVRPQLDNTSDNRQVRFAYNSGYDGLYSTGSSVVKGTGWDYAPWVGGTLSAPVYWGYPWTYGRHHWGYGHHYYPHGYYGGMQSVTLKGSSRGLGKEASPTEQDPALARRGYDYTTLDDQRQTPPQSAQSSLYAAPDGSIYRRKDDGWSKHNGSEWSTMADLQRQYGVSSPQPTQPENTQPQAYKQNQTDVERMERYYKRRAQNQYLYSEIYVGR